MKKFTTMEVVIWAVFASAVIGSIVYFMMTPAKKDVECSTEYVQTAGDSDCINKIKANENESNSIQESQLR